MNNNEPNKIINNLFKRYLKLSEDCSGDASKYDYEAENQIRRELLDIFNTVGSVEVMSKTSIFKLVFLNGRLRAIPFHIFHHPFADVLKIK